METQRLILRMRIKEELTNWKLDSKFWDLVAKDNKKVLGHCGFHTWDKDSHQAEIGYGLQKKYQKKGYMLEALPPMIAFGFSVFKNLDMLDRILTVGI